MLKVLRAPKVLGVLVLEVRRVLVLEVRRVLVLEVRRVLVLEVRGEGCWCYGRFGGADSRRTVHVAPFALAPFTLLAPFALLAPTLTPKR